jgi:hypothetical protein
MFHRDRREVSGTGEARGHGDRETPEEETLAQGEGTVVVEETSGGVLP